MNTTKTDMKVDNKYENFSIFNRNLGTVQKSKTDLCILKRACNVTF